MASIAESLAQWSTQLEPTTDDLALAQRSLATPRRSRWPSGTTRWPRSRPGCRARRTGLVEKQLATAMVLAVPAAGGRQNAFGTHGNSLQVGFAA
ncbi:hypothetical protein ACWDKQ_14715 [Saccharopolyspora sp. NPDC000995]